MTRLGQVELPKTHPLCPNRSSFKITAKLQEEICFLGQMCVYQEASDLLKRMLGIDICNQQIRRVCKFYGESVDDVIDGNIEHMIPRIKQTNEQDPTYVMIDGALLFTRSGEWKELKLARMFKGSKVIDIQKDRSEIVDTVYCSHLGSVNDFFPKLERHLVGYSHLVVVGDGAPWIWRWCEDNYPGCVQILDFFHAKEKLVLLANAHYNNQEKKKHWLENQLELLKNDGVLQIKTNVKKLACKSEPAKEAKKKLLKYYTEHEDRMTYKTFMDSGYLIGSGPIEAAHRSVIQQRMKLSGQKWSIDGANAIANLRCFNKSGAWENIRTLIKANVA